MNTPESIYKFCEEFGYKPTMATKTEYKALPSIIAPDETLLGVVEGILQTMGNSKIEKWGILMATNKRVVFYSKNIMGIERKEDFPLSRISSVSYRKGIMYGAVYLTAASSDILMDSIDKSKAEKIVNVINDLLSKTQSQGNTTVNNNESVATQIEKLFDLKQKGILTDDEFSQQKSKLLNI